MATIRKRGSTWQAQIRRQDAQPISRSFSTKAEAILWARELERSIDRAELPANPRELQSVRLADLITRYETEITAKKRGASQERYKLRVIRAHAISNLPLSKTVTLCHMRFSRRPPQRGANRHRQTRTGPLATLS